MLMSKKYVLTEEQIVNLVNQNVREGLEEAKNLLLKHASEKFRDYKDRFLKGELAEMAKNLKELLRETRIWKANVNEIRDLVSGFQTEFVKLAELESRKTKEVENLDDVVKAIEKQNALLSLLINQLETLKPARPKYVG